MEEKEYKEEKTLKISIKALFQSLKIKWKLTLIVGLVSLLLSSLGLFLYSRENNMYVSNFQMEWPGIENNQFPDTSTFNYKSITSLDNLQKVKESNTKFSDLDVEKMFYKNNIIISQKIDNKVQNNSNFGFIYNYKISVNEKYFKNKEIASEFIKELIECASYDIAYDSIENYKIINYFKFQDENTEYSEIIQNIGKEVVLLHNVMNDIVQKSSPDFIYDKENKVSLGELDIEYKSFLKNNDFQTLENEMLKNYYVRNENDYKSKYQEKSFNLSQKIKDNDNKIQSLKNSLEGNYGDDAVPQMIANITLENEQLKKEKQYYDDCLNNGGKFNEDFDNKINLYIEKLLKFNNELVKAYKEVNLPKVYIEYNKNKVLSEDGIGILKICVYSVIFVILIEFMLSLILANTISKKDLIVKDTIK